MLALLLMRSGCSVRRVRTAGGASGERDDGGRVTGHAQGTRKQFVLQSAANGRSITVIP